MLYPKADKGNPMTTYPNSQGSATSGFGCVPVDGILATQGATPSSDVLLSEMHHRWFNSLAVLSASLRICAMTGKSPADILFRLGTVDSQIQSMAAMHRRLYAPPSEPDCVEGYCRALCIDVVLSHSREEITPWVTMCDVSLCKRTLLALGGLVVELMTNALKHGRAPKSGGIVWMQMRQLSTGWLELSVTDNFRPPVTMPEIPTIIDALVRDIGGDVMVHLTPGYATRVRFPAT